MRLVPYPEFIAGAFAESIISAIQTTLLCDMLGANMVLLLRKEIDLLKLRRRHLTEQIALRYEGLRNNIVVWETTVELGLKVVLYLALSCLWWTCGVWIEVFLSNIGEASRLDDRTDAL
jgi:hypothetical protein